MLDSLIETRKRINEEACKNIEEAQARQINYNNRHDVSCDIKVGDTVAIKNCKREYIVVNSLGEGRLKLQNADGKKL